MICNSDYMSLKLQYSVVIREACPVSSRELAMSKCPCGISSFQAKVGIQAISGASPIRINALEGLRWIFPIAQPKIGHSANQACTASFDPRAPKVAGLQLPTAQCSALR